MLGIVVGGVGVAACLVALVLVWVASARFRESVDVLFHKMHCSLDLVGQRLLQAQDGIGKATQSADQLEAKLRDRVGLESREQAAWRQEAEARVARLSAALDQVERGLETAESAVSLVQDRLALSASTGVSADPTPVDQLLQSVASLRVQTREARECIVGAGQRLTETRDVESRGTRTGSLQMADRAVALLAAVQPGLATLASRVSVTQSRLHETRSATKRQIMLITWAVALLFVWMGAGQVALCRLAWRRP